MNETGLRRAPFQVLVLPFRSCADAAFEYALLRRSDGGYWQGVAGGGEGVESPLDATRREAREEIGVPSGIDLVSLDSMATVPVVYVTGDLSWGPNVLVVPEHAFGLPCGDAELRLSEEHTEYRWFSLSDAMSAVRWDSNRNALWELDHRLRHQMATTAG